MGRVLHANNRRWVISVLLVTLLVRALIPAGFMPASDRPLSFQICPDGFPAALLAATPADPQHHEGSGDIHAAHHHPGGNNLVTTSSPVAHHHDGASHNHNSASAEHCVFAAAAGAGALAFAPTLSAPATTSLAAPPVSYVAPTAESRGFRVQQPRGPPALS